MSTVNIEAMIGLLLLASRTRGVSMGDAMHGFELSRPTVKRLISRAA